MPLLVLLRFRAWHRSPRCFLAPELVWSIVRAPEAVPRTSIYMNDLLIDLPCAACAVTLCLFISLLPLLLKKLHKAEKTLQSVDAHCFLAMGDLGCKAADTGLVRITGVLKKLITER